MLQLSEHSALLDLRELCLERFRARDLLCSIDRTKGGCEGAVGYRIQSTAWVCTIEPFDDPAEMAVGIRVDDLGFHSRSRRTTKLPCFDRLRARGVAILPPQDTVWRRGI